MDRNFIDDGKDYLGQELKAGQTVARAVAHGRAANIKIASVSRADETGVYLDGWHSPVHYSGRLLIIYQSEADVRLAFGMTA